MSSYKLLPEPCFSCSLGVSCDLPTYRHLEMLVFFLHVGQFPRFSLVVRFYAIPL